MACGHLLPASATHFLVMALMVCRAATVQGVQPSGVHSPGVQPPGVHFTDVNPPHVHPSDVHPPSVQPTGMRLPAPPHEDGYCRLMELGYVDYATYIDQAFTRCYTHVYWSENAVFTTWWNSNCNRWLRLRHLEVATL
ncbi:PREDICTED: uncharacterized protein LOC106814973 [Priapulus caudatus]|uniref:Uncharacterized protein LOC106814973 n=1 Tax=Priapulus caudatus TaxID=37621 RepID=A0ABM1ERN7_PRICU|nr:PREDICTED: uncharacterized protein LOC106814973 [Priapulus caudatus]